MDTLLGIGKKSWQRYESGGQSPGLKVLAALTKQGINVNWLMEGEVAGPMLLNDAERAQRIDLLNAVDVHSEASQAQFERLRSARALVERAVAEVGLEPGSAMMGSLIMTVCLHDVSEAAVRDLVKGMMIQAALDARS